MTFSFPVWRSFLVLLKHRSRTNFLLLKAWLYVSGPQSCVARSSSKWRCSRVPRLLACTSQWRAVFWTGPRGTLLSEGLLLQPGPDVGGSSGWPYLPGMGRRGSGDTERTNQGLSGPGLSSPTAQLSFRTKNKGKHSNKYECTENV